VEELKKGKLRKECSVRTKGNTKKAQTYKIKKNYAVRTKENFLALDNYLKRCNMLASKI
jgi:hypothetical protein